MESWQQQPPEYLASAQASLLRQYSTLKREAKNDPTAEIHNYSPEEFVKIYEDADMLATIYRYELVAPAWFGIASEEERLAWERKLAKLK